MLMETASFIQRELSSREQLLWSGEPRKGFVLHQSDWTTIPFFFLWIGIPLSLAVTSLRNGQLLSEQLWNIPFILIGLYMVYERYVQSTLLRRNTYYGVTNERVVIVSNWFGRKTKSLNLEALHQITIEEKSDGSGTITFGHSLIKSEEAKQPAKYESFKLSPASPVKKIDYEEDAAPSLEMIPNVRTVFNLIREAQYHLEQKSS